MKSRIKIGSGVITRHTPPIRGICTQITNRGHGHKEYLVAHNHEGKIVGAWLDQCEVMLVDDAIRMGFGTDNA